MPVAIKKLLEGLVGLLEQWAAMTETKLDDSGVAILKLVLASDILSQWFSLQLVSAEPAKGEWDVTGPVREEMTNAGFDEEDIDNFVAVTMPTVAATLKSVL